MAPRAKLQQAAGENQSAVVIHALGAETASGVSADLSNPSARGASIIVDITAVGGTAPTMTFKLQAKDAVSGKYVDIPDAVTTALAGVGTTMLTIYPGIDKIANSKVNGRLQRDWRLVWTIGGTGGPSVTFSASVALLN